MASDRYVRFRERTIEHELAVRKLRDSLRQADGEEPDPAIPAIRDLAELVARQDATIRVLAGLVEELAKRTG